MRKSLLLAAALLFASLPSAKASVINFAGLSSDMGILENGQTGTISNFSDQPYFYGVLPKNSKLTFSYTKGITPFPAPKYQSVGMTATTFTSPSNFKTQYTYYAGGWSAPSFYAVDMATDTEIKPDGLVLLTANITPDRIDGVIDNKSGLYAHFVAQLMDIAQAGVGSKITYAVSAVPVPAALPLFAFALAGAAGYSRRKKSVA